MKHKKTIIIGVIVLAVVLIISALVNSTYALFSTDAYGANTNAYTTGMLSIEASSKSENISLTNALPMTDEEGLKSNPYVFTIKNVGNLDYLFDVKLLSTGSSETTFSSQYIKLQIDDGDVVTLSSLTNGVIKSDVTLLAGDSIDISIRIWLSIDTPNTEIGKSFNSKIVTDGQAVYTSSNNELNINATQYITSLYAGAEKTVVTNNGIEYNQAQSVSLMNDRLGGTTAGYDSGNIRYYGADPDNYIYFNCSDYNNQSDETCEKWRIIGVVDGKLKIIRDESIGRYSFSCSDSSCSVATSDWNSATLMTLLNESYYNNVDDIIYYSFGNTSSSDYITDTINFGSDGIGIKNSQTQNLISNSQWSLGGIESNSYANLPNYSDELYDLERNSLKYDTWSGKIALIYASDYAYATDFSKCDSTISNYYSSDNSYACRTNDWLYKGDEQWTLTFGPYFPYRIDTTGGLSYEGQSAMNAKYIYPTLYLNSDVSFNTKGNGTSSNPYQIYVEPIKGTTLIDHITNLYTNADKTVVTNNSIQYNQAQSVSLMNDRLGGTTTDYDDGNIRYYGADPDNYIYFNCSDYSDTTTCEVWRIIGIVDGKVKIIRNDSIGDYAWDNDDYTNNWSTSTLNTYLNGDYYNSLNTKNSKTIGLISSATYYLGGYDTSEVYSNQIYTYERTNEVGTTIYSGNPFTINANIGIMYASDYGYGTDFNECTSDLYLYDNDECYSNDWLYNEDYQWLITPLSDYSDGAWAVGSSGFVSNHSHNVGGANGVRPVLYLNSELVIGAEGDGSSTEPYRINVS